MRKKNRLAGGNSTFRSPADCDDRPISNAIRGGVPVVPVVPKGEDLPILRLAPVAAILVLGKWVVAESARFFVEK